MGTAFQQMFAVFAMFFSALYQLMSGFNNAATWVNEASGAFADTSRHDRQQALAKMMAEAGIDELPKAAPMPAPSDVKKLAKPVVPKPVPAADPNPIQLPTE